MQPASSEMVLDVAIEPAEHDSRLIPSPAPAGSDDDTGVRYSVLSPRAIWWTAGLIVLVGLGMAVWLLLAFGEGGDQARNQLEAIKTAGTIVIGTGGAAALLLAARRQRTAEIALKQKDRDHVDAARAHALQERIAKTTEADAAARRVTELYTTATAQLGSDKAPVRLAGLYALERLAQDNPSQRQTIVNVLCAYLRMPYTTPSNPSDPVNDVDQIGPGEPTGLAQEREVRLTAQRLLTAHLRPEDIVNPTSTFWADIDLDLTDAVLIAFDLDHCHLRTARFTRTRFVNGVTFANTIFTENVMFDNAKFVHYATFTNATFEGRVRFDDATFTGYVTLDNANFARGVRFNDAKFTEYVTFDYSKFAGNVTFYGAEFAHVRFAYAKFTSMVTFERAKFDKATFKKTEFADGALFKAVLFARGAPFDVRQYWSPPPEVADAAEDEEWTD